MGKAQRTDGAVDYSTAADHRRPGNAQLPLTAAEELLEIIMRRYERASTLLTSNRPVDDWGKLLGDSAAVTAMLDRLLHHGHVLKCGPRSWRTKTSSTGDRQ
jgi:DNA replication protein DnaC